MLPPVTQEEDEPCVAYAAAQVHAFRRLSFLPNFFSPPPHHFSHLQNFSPSESDSTLWSLLPLTNRFRILKHMYKNRVHVSALRVLMKRWQNPHKNQSIQSDQSLRWSEELGKCWEQLFKWRWGELLKVMYIRQRGKAKEWCPLFGQSSIWWYPSLMQVLLWCLVSLYYVKSSLSKSSSGPPAHTSTPSLYSAILTYFRYLNIHQVSSPPYPVPHYSSSKLTHILTFSDITWAGRPLLTLSLGYLLRGAIHLVL